MKSWSRTMGELSRGMMFMRGHFATPILPSRPNSADAGTDATPATPARPRPKQATEPTPQLDDCAGTRA